MLKLQTPVDIAPGKVKISAGDKVMVLGSCFAENIGRKMAEAGMDVCSNPFGVLYNPASIAYAVERMRSGKEFGMEDCRMMGSGAGMVCSFSHHTSFARRTAEEFLENANSALGKASSFFRECGKLIVTFGTSWCYRHIGDGRIVSNCLKRNEKEFQRFRLDLDGTTGLIRETVKDAPGCCPKQTIFTVSPIRHFRDGAHENQLSKSNLLLAVDNICRENPSCDYFPAYEIVLDELRDYRFYAEDMVHPSQQAVDYIWERFCETVMSDADRARIKEKEKESRQLRHRPVLAR